MRRRPKALARVLFSAAKLPKRDPVRDAAERCMARMLFESSGGFVEENSDRHEMARALGVSVRQVQRLIVAYFGKQR